MVTVLVEEHNIHIYTYIITYPQCGTHVFNAGCAALHTLKELIHILRKRPQDISRSPRFMCIVVSRTTDTQPLPHNRDCPQVSLVLRVWVWNSHHPAGGNLPSYLVVDALLQNSKLHKVKTESKTLLACYLLRIL
jgi:hypothetical protein